VLISKTPAESEDVAVASLGWVISGATFPHGITRAVMKSLYSKAPKVREKGQKKGKRGPKVDS
jgi:hypothetical protein